MRIAVFGANGRELEERRYALTAMGIITTAVKPNIAGLISNEGVMKE